LLSSFRNNGSTLISYPFNRSAQVQLMLYALCNPFFVEEFACNSLSKTNMASGVKKIFQQQASRTKSQYSNVSRPTWREEYLHEQNFKGKKKQVWF
jgi:hypothetical protein